MRVFLRPIGAPLTIGMAGLAIGSLVQAGLDLGWIAKTEGRHVGLILIVVPFVLQAFASIYAYLARDGAAGASMGILATTWLGLGVVHLTSSPGARSGALGLLLLAAGGTLACSAAGVSIAKPLVGVILTLAAARFALSGIHELGGVQAWMHAAGIVSCVVCGLAVYGVVAFEIEGQLHHPVLPTLRRGVGRTALAAGLDAQAREVENEAGVRQTS